MDSDALIKLTKVKAKEIMLRAMEVCIPLKVFEETVEVPKKERYSDAFLIEDNVKKGMLKVKEVEASKSAKEMVGTLGIRGGEADVLRLYKSGDWDFISSDDSKFLRTLETLGVPFLTPTAIIIYLYHKRELSRERAKEYLNALKEIVSDEEYYVALKEVDE